jgi:prolyl oligopeptidase
MYNLISLAAALFTSINPPALTPPATKTEPVKDVVHGVEIVDDFRWLEPLEKDSAEVAEWTTAQNDYTRATLEQLPCRAALAKAMEPWMTLGSIGAPRATDLGYYYSERSGTQNQGVVMFRSALDSPAKVILDVNTLDSKGLTSLDWWTPNERGNLMAFGLSQQGSEMSELHIYDLELGTWLADEIVGKVQLSGWMPDGKSFFYSGLRDVKDPYSRETRYHVVGTSPRFDRVLLQQTNPSEIPSAGPTSDGKWLIGSLSKGWQANDLWAVELDGW